MFDASEFQALLVQADAEFVSKSAERMEAGAEKYGALKFLTVDTLGEAMDEVLDLSNYARMTYIKLYLLRAQLAQLNADNPVVDNQGFVPTKEFRQ
jgi:hypothetical protein